MLTRNAFESPSLCASAPPRINYRLFILTSFLLKGQASNIKTCHQEGLKFVERYGLCQVKDYEDECPKPPRPSLSTRANTRLQSQAKKSRRWLVMPQVQDLLYPNLTNFQISPNSRSPAYRVPNLSRTISNALIPAFPILCYSRSLLQAQTRLGPYKAYAAP